MTTPFPSTTTPVTQLLSESELVRTLLADDYEILEELGRGGMAVVFRAREKALDREVAIKVLPARLMIDKDFVERFEHEARTSAKLEHPNIIPIYRVGRVGPNGEVLYFVMKLLRGQSLSAVLKQRGKLDASDVRRILMESAAALGYAAKRGVVHRDIKPDNILLDSEGRCVITDFGIAKAPGGQKTAAGTSLGTPLYMSPEHAAGSPLDGRSDMYSLGVVAYQCLFGKTPFSADDPFAVLYKHINEPVPQPTLTTDDEKTLYAVIARMLAKKPDDRFQTGNEVIAALGGEVSGPNTLVPLVRTSMGLMLPTEMIPTPQPWYSPKWSALSTTGKRVWMGIGPAVAVVGLVIQLNRGNNTPSAPSPAVTTAAATKGPAAAAAIVPNTDSTKVTQTAKTPPSSMMSERAAAILAYNKLKSSCARLPDTLATSKRIAYGVLLDSIRDRKRSDKMVLGYDVCGLGERAVFSTIFTLTKLNQHGLGKQAPYGEPGAGQAIGPRTHLSETLNVKEMSAGSYRLDVVVTDVRKRKVTASREFKITDK
jgi:serine/threonine protein kinase